MGARFRLTVGKYSAAPVLILLASLGCVPDGATTWLTQIDLADPPAEGLDGGRLESQADGGSAADGGGESPDADQPVDGGSADDAGSAADSGPIADAGPSPDDGFIADAGARPDGGSGVDGGLITDAGPAVNCTETWNVPPAPNSAWSPVLSHTGAVTLTRSGGHSHDDGRGPLGFCPAAVAPGALYLALVSARLEIDEEPPLYHCVTDYLAPDDTFRQWGVCNSGGNRHIYVEVRDQAGQRVVAGFQVFYSGGSLDIADQGKPAHEFPMNFPINGGGATYGVRAQYRHSTAGLLPSEAVTNMRLPGNHHLAYLLTFQVTQQ